MWHALWQLQWQLCGTSVCTRKDGGNYKVSSPAVEPVPICNEVQTFQQQFAASSDQNSEIETDFLN